ncbi:KAP family P-loop NTPase fold protein [Psychromonas sp. Urea-02u-13]|uniref:KAP family P-loop NTPase fold protein n=1 Tax=Psychromonas sp. Urea-02u-13 TaxID=2058326 RepID=UPI000C341480|nr:P-loop NTPase fold protein [Psychromonas sp. Urea-02u-13]PKG39144.1 NTPase [Psychromonas sp. Urea-02u-13]
MNNNDKHGFSSDRPINTTNDDLLGRSGFSIDLANVIADWHGNDSLVVALHGDWGSGKSSIKNMALDELKKTAEHNPDIIEFSPWEWAAQDKITASFFKEISSTIGLKDKSANGKKLAKLFSRYGRYLNTGEIVTTGLIAAVPTLIAIFALFGLTFFDTWVTQVCLGVMAIWVVALKWGKKLLKQLAGSTDASAKEEELTLSQLRHALTKLLKERDKSVIIVLDDLDRLTTKQLQMVFQLVKANTEFPNVVFLLLFQRDLVEDKLTDGKQKGRDYLEKIIQVPFDIPKIETSRIHELLFQQLNEILDTDKFAITSFNPTYWGNVFHSSLADYFNNLRNVYRFTSTFSFHFSLYQGENAFEVNPVDLIAIECLRLFEPDLYKKISQSKDFFTNYGTINDRDARAKEEEKYNQILNLASGNKDRLKGLLHHIFPGLERISGTTYASGHHESWLRGMRICHSSNFEKYFLFSMPSGELSHSELQEMLSLTNDSLAFSSFLKELHKREILKNSLGQFMAFIEKIPTENSRSFICSLLNACDEIGNDDFSFSLNSINYMTIYVENVLKGIEDIDERSKLIFECFKEPESGLNVIESILVYEETKRKDNNGETLLSNSIFEHLKIAFVDKLDLLSVSKENVLIRHPQIGSFIYRWKRWGNDEKVSSWLIDQIKDPEYGLLLLKSFVQKGSSWTSGSRVSRKTAEINLENIEQFFPINLIEDSLKHLNRENLDSSEQEAIEAFTDAIAQREAS